MDKNKVTGQMCCIITRASLASDRDELLNVICTSAARIRQSRTNRLLMLQKAADLLSDNSNNTAYESNGQFGLLVDGVAYITHSPQGCLVRYWKQNHPALKH